MMTSLMASVVASPRRPDDPYKYLYFNRMNLAIKHSVRGSRPSNLIKDVTQLLIEVREDLRRFCRYKIQIDARSEKPGVSSADLSEVCIKTGQDCWVVAKASNGREFFVISDQKNYSLVEINGLLASSRSDGRRRSAASGDDALLSHFHGVDCLYF
jgi:hypothetical protein